MSVITIYSKIDIKNPYNHIYKDIDCSFKNYKKHNNNYKFFLKKSLICLISFLLFYNNILFAVASTSSIDYIQKADYEQNITIDKTQNNIPLININNSNADGISRNDFLKYNVGSDNLIINNSKENIETNLGGMIYGNQNMRGSNGREADIILNEVVGNNVTKLEGYTEIAGKKAELIIANPNGIYIKGAGFINTSKLNLINGKSVNNSINEFDLNSNQNNIGIIIEGRNVFKNDNTPLYLNLGLDVSSVDITIIASKLVKINAKIVGNESNELNIKTGNNKAIRNNDNYDVNSDNTTNNTTFAIDSKNFDGMYAGRIKFVLTENNSGINIENGNIISNLDDIEINSKGDVIIKNTNNSKTSLDSKNDISITSNKNINIDNNSELNSKNDIKLKSDIVENNGKITSVNNSEIEAKELINNNFIYSNNDLNIKSDLLNNIENASIIANNNLNINVLNSDFINNGLLQSNNKVLKIKTNNDLINNNIINSTNGSIVIKSKNVANNSIIKALNNLEITAINGEINNNDLLISKNASIVLKAKTLNNNNAIVYAGEDIDLIIDDTINNVNNSLINAKNGNIKIVGNSNDLTTLGYLNNLSFIGINFNESQNIFEALKNNCYIDLNGNITNKFINLKNYTELELGDLLNIYKKDVFDLLRHNNEVVNNDLIENNLNITFKTEKKQQELLELLINNGYYDTETNTFTEKYFNEYNNTLNLGNYSLLNKNLSNQIIYYTKQIANEQKQLQNDYENELLTYNNNKNAIEKQINNLDNNESDYTEKLNKLNEKLNNLVKPTLPIFTLIDKAIFNNIELPIINEPELLLLNLRDAGYIDDNNKITDEFKQISNYNELNIDFTTDDNELQKIFNILNNKKDGIISEDDFSNDFINYADIFLNELKNKNFINNEGYLNNDFVSTELNDLKQNLLNNLDAKYIPYVDNIATMLKNLKNQPLEIDDLNGIAIDSQNYSNNIYNALKNLNIVNDSNEIMQNVKNLTINDIQTGLQDNLKNYADDVYYILQNIINNPNNQKAINYLNNNSSVIKARNILQINANKIDNIAVNNQELIENKTYKKEYKLTGEKAGLYSTVRYAQDYITVLLTSKSAELLAGNDLILISNIINNRSSNIISGNNINIKTDILNNERNDFTLYNLVYQTQYKGKKKRNAFGGYKEYYKYKNYTYNQVFYSNTASTIKAKNNLIISANKNITQDAQLSHINDISIVDTNINERDKEINEINDNIAIIKGNIESTVENIRNNPLFKPSKDLHYLFETRDSFRNPNLFITSKYFIDRVGFNLNDDVKLFGDARTEYEFIKMQMDATREAPQIRFIESEEEKRMKELTENGVEYVLNNLFNDGYKIGEPLTADQRKAITKDMILYEYQIINGNKVLVPVLYYAYNSGKMNDNRSTIESGNDMILITNNDLVNSGNIISNKDLTIISDNDIINRGGTIQTNSDDSSLKLIAGNNITNEAIINSNTFKTKSHGKELTNIYSDLVSKGNIGSKGNNSSIILNADKDINILGSNIETKGNASDIILQSENGNVNILAEQVYNRMEDYNKSESFMFSSETHQIEDSLKNISSNINSNGNLSIITKGNDNNINILGSILNTKEDLNLESNGNINILNVKDSEYSYYKHRESKINLGNILSSVVNGIIVTTIAEQLGVNDFLLANSTIGIATGIMPNNKPIYSEDTTIRETFNQNVVSSSLNSENNINIISKKDTNIQTSDLNSDNDVNIATIDGNVNILTSFNETTVKNTSKYKEIGKTFIEAKGGSLSAGLKGEMSSGDVKNTTKTAVSSNIDSNNNVNIISGDNINIIGSNIGSNNETNLTAENNVNILSTENLESTSGEFKEGELKIGVKVGNAYIDTYNASDTLVKACEDAKHAKDELHRIKQLEKEGKASKSAVKDAELNLAMATINLTNATIAFAGSAAGAATAASTSFGTGFYGSAFESFEGTKTKSSSETVTNKESQIITNNGDINVIAKNNNITQKGSLVFSDNGDINYRANNDINIIASQDTFKASSKTENINESVSVGNNAMQVGFGYGKSTSNTNSITNNNSVINTNNGNITLITDNNDINIKGANIEANNIDIDVANNLNIESLQDSYYNKSNSNNFGLNVGGNSNSINGGFNIGSSKGTIDNQWVNNQTSIIGNDKVDIKVGTKENSEGNTNIKGSLIASGNYDNTGNFVDNSNLTLTTNILVYEDIKDFYNNTSKGFNFGTSIGANKTDQNDINLHPQGTTTIGLTNKGEEKEQITKTTVGNGNISVKNKINGKDILINENNKSNQNTLLSDLNRDINKSQQTTKDQITGALDGNTSIDNRLFTSEGRNEVVEEVKDIRKNTNLSLGGVSETIYNLGGKYFNDMVSYLDEKLNNAGLIGDGVQLIISPIVGTSNFLLESRSNLYTKDGIVDDASKATNYYINGIQNSEENIEEVLNMKNTDTVARYNPDSSGFADVVESTLGKAFNLIGFGGVSRMSRLEAQDFYDRKDMTNVNNVSHSQGTIIMTGALQYYADRYGANNINPTQNFVFTGPAVNEGQTKSVIRNVGLDEKDNTSYEHDKKDPVNYITNINRIPEGTKKGINGELDFKSHTFINNYDYYKYLLLDYNNQTPINNNIKRP